MFKSSLRTAALAAVGPVALVVFAHSAHAQVPVGAGGQLQQIPPVPLGDKPTLDLPLERTPDVPQAVPGGPKVLVQSLRITGATVFPESELLGAASFAPNTQLDLSELRTIAARITAYYAAHGYFVAQAYLPEQDIQSGTVTIAVVEGVTARSRCVTRADCRTASPTASSMASKSAIRSPPHRSSGGCCYCRTSPEFASNPR